MGFEPGRLGAPWKLADGRTPARAGEIAVDRVMASSHRLEPGDALVLRGRRFRVVGLSDRTASWMTPLVFVSLPSHYLLVVAAALLMGLVGALVPARVLARLDPAEVLRR